MKKVFLMVAAFGMLAMLTGCCDSSKKKTLDDYEVTENGLYCHFYNTNDGETPQLFEKVDVDLACYINDTITLRPVTNFVLTMREPGFYSDYMEGIGKMHKGDSASFIVDIDSTGLYVFNWMRLPKGLTSNDVMKFEVKVNDIYSAKDYAIRLGNSFKERYPQESERAYAELQQYFAMNNIVASHTETGLYYVMTEEGTGERPNNGDIVKVHYTGKLLDGTVFDSSVERGEPIEFPISLGVVIPGWEEGIMMMSKGEKGVLYIPYYIGYGDRGSGPIPPFANLIFEVELVDFQSK